MIKLSPFFYSLLCFLAIALCGATSLEAQNMPSQATGVADMLSSDSIAYHDGYSYYSDDNVYDLLFKGNSATIRMYPRMKSVPLFNIRFKSVTGIETHTGLAATQNQYAQGRSAGGSLQWRGPETGEIFAWGPAIRTLEYDGTAYDYDKHGRPVPAGTGNGVPVQSYNDDDFFRTAFFTSNRLQILSPLFIGKKAYVEINAGQTLRNSIIRNADYTNYDASLAIKDIVLSDHYKVEAKVSYNHSEDRLAAHGANLSSIVGSLLSTPPTFDNRNGLSAPAAMSGTGAWLLPSGARRSFAPGVADNPYGLLATLPDKDKHTDFLATVNNTYNYRYDNGRLWASLEGFFQYLTDDYTNGNLPGFVAYNDGRLSESAHKRTLAGLRFAPNYTLDSDFILEDLFYILVGCEETSLKIDADYLLNYTDEAYAIQNTSGSLSTDYAYKNSRTTHQLNYGFTISDDYDYVWTLRFGNSHYFSNTANAGDNTNFLPHGGLSLSIDNLFKRLWGDWRYDYWWQYLDIIFDARKTAREAPLVYNASPVRSTVLPSWQYNRFYEDNEIFFQSGLLPEIAIEYNAGISTRFRFPDSDTDMELWINYFNTTTKNFITPVFSSGKFVLTNAAQVNNYGWEISARLTGSTYDDLQYGAYLSWNTCVNKVQSTVNDAYIPVAGFSNISTGLRSGNPVNAIYGTSWLRDEQGNRIIGNNGFPLVNTDLNPIGDPTPDWTAGIAPFFAWRNWHFSFMVEFSKGGDKWNGTAAMLDYLGMSQSTADQRNVKNYLFDGVTVGGSVNNTPVDFYNPALPAEQNRWVRYGAAGVGEEYICDASFIRLSNVHLEYKFNNRHHKFLREITVGITANNLLLFTKYKGADPSSTLFNYPLATGLDLFNTPGVRSYLLTLKLNLGN